VPNLSFTDPIEVVLVNTVERTDFTLLDDSGVATDASSVTLNIYDSSQTLYLAQTYPAGSTRIQHPAVGYYYFNWGDYIPSPGVTNAENGQTGLFYLNWSVTPFTTTPTGGEIINTVQTVVVISLKTSAILQQFRLHLDKALKPIIDDPVAPMYVGYTEPMLLSYLAGGLSVINEMQPGAAGWARIDDFPDIHGQLLLDAAIWVAVNSQELFAIDTDIDSYSDQGNVWTILHQPKLAAFATRLYASLEKRVPQMKLQYVNTGMLHIEATTSYRLVQLMNAAPAGSIFRGFWAVV